MRDVFIAPLRNGFGLLGLALIIVSTVLLVTLVAIEGFGAEGHPYLGIVTYMFLPAVLVLGLVLFFYAGYREKRRVTEAAFPVLDFNVPRVRRRVLQFVFAFSVCAVVLATTTAKAVHYMESNVFCGEVCHSVMEPEYVAYQRSPHARVRCVDCHIGPGADWFVKSKLSGAWQLVSVNLNLYERPIPTPVQNLRPSAGTCEQCHWPAKFHGVAPKVITRFDDDEENTETKSILLVKVGGHDSERSQGIHWHMDPDVKIRYRSDPTREKIHEVELTREDGSMTTYVARGEEDTATPEWRTMDCVDCHNRPAHVFFDAGEAIDLVLERGLMAKDLPYIRREAERAVRKEYGSHADARAGIADHLRSFYAAEYPALSADRAVDIAEAGRVLGDSYATNVFPSMNIDWGTYKDHIGHQGSDGCFRCHSGNHASENDETIRVDCRICHTIVAWDEASPEILEMLKR